MHLSGVAFILYKFEFSAEKRFWICYSTYIITLLLVPNMQVDTLSPVEYQFDYTIVIYLKLKSPNLMYLIYIQVLNRTQYLHLLLGVVASLTSCSPLPKAWTFLQSVEQAPCFSLWTLQSFLVDKSPFLSASHILRWMIRGLHLSL